MIRFLDTEWVPISVPREWTPSLIELSVPVSDWQESRLWLQSQPLELSLRRGPAGQAHVVALVPRLNPGRYRLRLDVPGCDSSVTEFTVLPAKISPGSLDSMLEDLEHRLPVSIARSLQRLGPLAQLRLLPPSETTRAQELARLRQAVVGNASRAGLRQILQVLGRAPHRVLRESERWVRKDQARRVSATRLAHALVVPGNLDDNQMPHRVIDARVESSVDVYENQLVRVYVDQVARRLRRLSRFGARQSGLIEAEADALLGTLSAAQRDSPFLAETSSPHQLPTRVTMVLLRRPPYRAALEGYLALNRGLTVQLDEPALEAPLEELPRLYQVWGVLLVLDAVLACAAETGYTVRSHQLLSHEPDGLFVRVLPESFVALVLVHLENGTVVRALVEPRYGHRSFPLRSISMEQRPDLVIEVQRRGEPRVLHLFDPKYKLDSELQAGNLVSRPQKIDIDKMHAYRDAIRNGTNQPAVRYAAVMYPGENQRYPTGAEEPLVEALRAYPGAMPESDERIRDVVRQAMWQDVKTLGP